MFKIATLADWFGVGLIEGIRTSQRCGAEGVQVYAADEFDPRTVSKDMIATVRDTARSCGQTVTALCGELGGFDKSLGGGVFRYPQVDFGIGKTEIAASRHAKL